VLRRASGWREGWERDNGNVWAELLNQGGVEVSGGGRGKDDKSGVEGRVWR